MLTELSKIDLIGNPFVQETTEEAVLTRLVEQISRILGHGIITSMIYDDESSTLTPGPGYERLPLPFRHVLANLAVGSICCGLTALNKQVMIISDTRLPNLWTPILPKNDYAGIRAVWYVPIVFAGRLFGALIICHETPYAPEDEEVHLVTRIAEHAGAMFVFIRLVTLEKEFHSILSAGYGEKWHTVFRETDKLLREKDEQYWQLLEHAHEPIGILADGRWTYMNPAGLQMFGCLRKEEMIGRSYTDFLYIDAEEEKQNRIEDLIFACEKPEIIEQKWRSLEGRILFTEVACIPCSIGQKPYLQIMIRDISRQKNVEELLVISEKLAVVGQLAAGMAHEIRNPLTSLNGFLQLLRPKYGAQYAEYFDIMQSELKRIELISSEMLSLGKPKVIPYRHGKIDAIMKRVVTLLEAEAALNNIQISLEAMATKDVLCEENQLMQAFVNIIKNAIEAMPHGGILSIRLRDAENYVEISFEDQGSGIPEDVLARLGDPFLTTKMTGTGLGLTVTNNIIQSHKGTMTFTSIVGHGTTVKICLPHAN